MDFHGDRERAVVRHGEVLAHWREHGFGWRGIFDTDADDGHLIGIAALQRLRAPVAGIEEPAIEIGWWVDPLHWGKGIATEAATALRDEAFTDHGAARLVARYSPEEWDVFVAGVAQDGEFSLQWLLATVGEETK